MITLNKVTALGSTLVSMETLEGLPLVSKGYHRQIERIENRWRYVADRSPYIGSDQVIMYNDIVWSVE